MSTSFFMRRGGNADAGWLSAGVRVGHLYLDSQHRQLYCLNETARQLLREGLPISGEDLERQPLKTLAGAPVRAEDLPLLRAWGEGTPQEATFVLTRPGLAAQHLTWSAAPFQAPDGRLQGVVASVTVTAPEPDWQELAGLAHDLRTPLQALRLLVPVLESIPLLHADAAELLARLRSAADRALSISLDLLEWCRAPGQGSRRGPQAWLPLVPFLTSLAADLTAVAQRKGITLHTDLGAAGGVEAQTDQGRLGRLLTNLLSNAIRYTSAGEVHFRAFWRKDSADRVEALVVGVIDTGAGISPEDQESIFQPFERGKAGRESDVSGSGLGLAVVDRLVNELGLLLEVSSDFGRGSSFELLLPLSALRMAPETGDRPAPLPPSGR